MSNQQLFLLVFCSALAIGAVPGLVMGPPSPSGSKSTKGNVQIRDSNPTTTKSSSSKIPNTRLLVEKSTARERQDIKFSRKVNLNEATKKQLKQIKGVGPATAGNIVKYRQQGNVFYRVEDLDEIGGIGKRTVEDLRPFVTVGKKYLSEQSNQGEPKSKTVDLNTADRTSLRSLRGIGPKTADRILHYREKYGGFRDPSDLKNVTGIGDLTFEGIKDEVKTSLVSGIRDPSQGTSSSSTGRTGVGSINVNTASKSELVSLTGIGSVTANRIIKYREKHGPFESLSGLQSVDGIGSVTVEDIRDQASAH